MTTDEILAELQRRVVQAGLGRLPQVNSRNGNHKNVIGEDKQAHDNTRYQCPDTRQRPNKEVDLTRKEANRKEFKKMWWTTREFDQQQQAGGLAFQSFVEAKKLVASRESVRSVTAKKIKYICLTSMSSSDDIPSWRPSTAT